MPDRKGSELNNSGAVHVEKNGDRTEIFHGSGMPSGVTNNPSDGHSHTVIVEGQMVYDRSETGQSFTDTNKGDAPVDIPSADVTRDNPDWWDNN